MIFFRFINKKLIIKVTNETFCFMIRGWPFACACAMVIECCIIYKNLISLTQHTIAMNIVKSSIVLMLHAHC